MNKTMIKIKTNKKKEHFNNPEAIRELNFQIFEHLDDSP